MLEREMIYVVGGKKVYANRYWDGEMLGMDVEIGTNAHPITPGICTVTGVLLKNNNCMTETFNGIQLLDAVEVTLEPKKLPRPLLYRYLGEIIWAGKSFGHEAPNDVIGFGDSLIMQKGDYYITQRNWTDHMTVVATNGVGYPDPVILDIERLSR